LDNNQTESILNKQGEVTIEFQLNKEEKTAAIIQRRVSNISQNSSNKQEILSKILFC
jgi:hypothetical protein